MAYASKAYGRDAHVQQNYSIVAGRGGNLTIPSDRYLEIHGRAATGAFSAVTRVSRQTHFKIHLNARTLLCPTNFQTAIAWALI